MLEVVDGCECSVGVGCGGYCVRRKKSLYVC